MSRVSVLGVGIDPLSLDDVLDRVHDAVSSRSQLTIGVVNAAKLVNMYQDVTLRDDVTSSELVLADGMAVVWAARFLGGRLPERVPGIDLMYGMMRRASRHSYRFYLFGASEAVSAAVEKAMKQQFPDAIVAGRRNGYFSADDEEAIAGDIARSRADILLVAITSPIKERFMARWRDQLNVPVIHGVGGSFDVMAGKVQRAPQWMQRTGFEWLYRVIQEPRRMAWRYIRTNTLFIGYVSREWLSRALSRS